MTYALRALDWLGFSPEGMWVSCTLAVVGTIAVVQRVAS